ncbi:MAG TPA: hypothetical protein VIU61_20605 [Kofleriaceae bacterium]
MLTLTDLERAIATRDPLLGDLLVRYLEQPDPEPGKSELDSGDESYDAPDDDDGGDDDFDDDDDDDDDGDDDDDDEPTPGGRVDVPAGAVTYAQLKAAVTGRGLANKNPTEIKLARREAFAAAETSPFAPPRLRLGKLLVDLYEQAGHDDAPARAALIHVLTKGKLRWGIWQAAKAIYKRAEARHDAALFGALAYRFDAMTSLPYESSEIGTGTVVYLRRRAWRYLRLLGKAVPDAYPAFAVEVLRHYPASYGQHSPSWVAAHIWNHAGLRGYRNNASFAMSRHSDPMAQRAYPAAWKLSPAPLLRLLEAAENEIVADFAIRSLRADHALALRAVEPAWLARLGRRPVAAIHAFVVALLKESPELHQSKLRELGLHDMVIGFLRSPSQEARAYALDYAATHGVDLPIEDLVELVESGAAEVGRFAAARLESMSPQQLGLPALLRLLGAAAAPWAPTKLAEGFRPGDVTPQQFVDTAARGTGPFGALVKFYNDARAQVPATNWTTLLDDKRFGPQEWSMRSIVQTALTELGKRPAREIGIAWIQRALEDRNRTQAVVQWLDAGMLSGDDLDLTWLKGLVGKPRLRPIALRLLGDRRRVAPARVGLAWLLELARSSDGELAQFAQRMLLESFEPGDFADGDRDAGVRRLWELATGKKQPEAVRTFAATYLKAHHPELGKRLAEAKALGIVPRLTSTAYSQAIVQPLFDDDRPDVRRLAVAIAGEELLRWDRELVYELARAKHPEPRALGSELLLGVLVEGEARRVPADWINGPRLFQLAESTHKAAREVSLTLIRRLYDQVGGAERLAWLMDSPERDVRLFAVRLFWDRHRPKPWPKDYQPRKQVGAAIGTERFSDLTALRQFMRVVLFGLPPGRVGERDPLIEGAPKPERALPASIAKRRLIEALRDVALDDLELAKAIAPVLQEFTESTAKGEWHASVQALTALRARHAEALA